MRQKILIIAGCSQKKLPHSAPAIDLNQFHKHREIFFSFSFDPLLINFCSLIFDNYYKDEIFGVTQREKKTKYRTKKRVHIKIDSQDEFKIEENFKSVIFLHLNSRDYNKSLPSHEINRILNSLYS